MNETPDKDDIPEATVAPKTRRPLAAVWAVPIVAALIGGWIAVKAVLDQGPEITISFRSADGLQPGQTKIKYKDVDIGVVQTIKVAEDRKSVIVTAELDKDAKALLVEDTRFWVVRARISGGQVSGLGTLLSGSYIGMDPGKSKVEKKIFTGLEVQPVVTADLPGKHFILKAEELGSLDIGAPLFYRRIQVGSVVAYELDADGTGVALKAFVHAPYDKYVNQHTRFWNASGIDVALNAEGLHVRTQGLAAVIAGGIAFQTPLYAPQNAASAPADTVFELFDQRDAALKRPITQVQQWVLIFDDGVRGLSPGSPVEFMGVTVGEVSAVSLLHDANKQSFHAMVDVSFYPERLWERVRGPRPQTNEQRAALMQGLLDRGLRAQLRSGNLITGQLYIALDFFPDAAKNKTKIDFSRSPMEVPTVKGDMRQLQDTLRLIAKRLEEVPVAEIGKELNKTLSETSRLMESMNKDIAPEVRATLQSIQETLKGAQSSMLSDDAPLQQDLRETLRDLGEAAKSLRQLADYLERHPESLIRGKAEDKK